MSSWKEECSGLGYMILVIATEYRAAKELGGDSEFLAHAIAQAEAYVRGPLAQDMVRKDNDDVELSGNEGQG